jgi:hypothetical protein
MASDFPFAIVCNQKRRAISLSKSITRLLRGSAGPQGHHHNVTLFLMLSHRIQDQEESRPVNRCHRPRFG